MRRSYPQKPLLLAVGAVAVGGVVGLVRSWRRRAIAAREVRLVSVAQPKAVVNSVGAYKLIDVVADASSPLTFEGPAAICNHLLLMSLIKENIALKKTVFNLITSRMTIPRLVGFGDFSEIDEGVVVDIIDHSVVKTLAAELPTLMVQLNELDIAYQWPAGADDLLWTAYKMSVMFGIVYKRSPGLVQPILLIQGMTLQYRLNSLLSEKQQKRAAALLTREPTRDYEIVEINDNNHKEEAVVRTLPAINTAPVPARAQLDRSISNASSSGTPGGATPLSAHGSVLGPFNTNADGRSSFVKDVEKSPLGRVAEAEIAEGEDTNNTVGHHRNAGSPGTKNKSKKANSESKLNPYAKSFKPKALNPAAKQFVPPCSTSSSDKLNPLAHEFVPRAFNDSAKEVLFKLNPCAKEFIFIGDRYYMANVYNSEYY